MPRSKKPAEPPETQFKRFQETAEKVGVDPAAAEKVFVNLAKKTRKKPKSVRRFEPSSSN